MSVRGKAVEGAFLVVVAMFVFATAAQACSCAPQAPAESLREADGAIVATLVRVIPRSPTRAVYRYRVKHVYKGAKLKGRRMLDVRSARRSAACALPRRTRRDYGLFLLRRRGRWTGGICGVVNPRRLRRVARGRQRTRKRGSAAGCPA